MKTVINTRRTRSLAVIAWLALGLGVVPALADTDTTPPATQTDKAPVAVDTSGARKACTDAMNADKKFAEEIVTIADENAAHRREQATLQAHQDAQDHIVKNEKHVVYAYSAMWVVAALFVVFLWRRQMKLSTEIIQLRRELAAATNSTDPTPAK